MTRAFQASLPTIRATMAARHRPLHAHNAIEAAAFSLVFAREFSAEECSLLLGLKSEFAEELPSFQQPSSVVLNFVQMGPDGKVMPQAMAGTGVLLQSFSRDGQGRVEWQLRAEGKQIVVICHQFTDWGDVWPKVRRMLEAAARHVDAPSNGVTEITLQVIDRFVVSNRPAEADYSLGDVFRQQCPYLTPHAWGAGPFWHVHQGFWAPAPVLADIGAKILTQVNLSGIEDIAHTEWSAVLDHQASLRPGAQALPVAALQADAGGQPLLVAAFAGLHRDNLRVVRNSLTDEQLDAIGLARNE